MHGLKVRRHQVGVPSRHLQRGVPEHLLQMEYGAAAPQIVHCERVPECVESAPRSRESQLAAQQLHVPQSIAAAPHRLGAAGEQKGVWLAAIFADVAEQGFPQLETEGDHPLFAPLAVQRDQQVLKVDIGDAQREGLGDATAGIQQSRMSKCNRR